MKSRESTSQLNMSCAFIITYMYKNYFANIPPLATWHKAHVPNQLGCVQ